MKAQTNKAEKANVMGNEIELSIEELEGKVAPESLGSGLLTDPVLTGPSLTAPRFPQP
jgi:hypothetical protein